MPIVWTWRTDFVNVRNQGPVESCWAFSSVTAAAYEYFHSRRELVGCSQQQLIDQWQTRCASILPIGRRELQSLFDYIENIGLVLEADYPYTAVKDRNAEIPSGHRFQIDSYFFIDPYSTMNDVFEILHEHVVIASTELYYGFHYPPFYLDILDPEFVFTSEHAHYLRDWSGMRHMLVIVGYGVTSDGMWFYELHNSYGPSWGDQGFCRMECSLVTPLAYFIV